MTNFKSALIAPTLAILLSTSLNAEQFSVSNLSLKQAIEEISKKSNMPYMVDGKLLDGKRAPNIKNIEGVENALNEILKGTNLKAVIEDGTILIKEKASGKGTVLDDISVNESRASTNYTVSQDNSATGMNLSLKETPQSVSVITNKRMQDQQLNTLNDVVKQTVGLSLTTKGQDVGATNIWSRGYEIKNIQVDGASNAFFRSDDVGYDGIEMAIYDSVSIVRGATGLLTGAGDPSGSINLVRKKPTKDFQALLEAQAGRWDKYRGVVDIGGGFTEDGSIRGRLVAVYDEGGFYMPELKRERKTIYGVVEADLSDYTTLTTSYEHNAQDSNVYDISINAPKFYKGYTQLTPFDKNTWLGEDWFQSDRARDNLSLGIEHHFNDNWKLNANYSFIQTDSKHKFFEGWQSGFGTDNIYLSGETTKGHNKDDTHAIDIKLNGTFDLWGQTHTLLFGANGLNSKNKVKLFDNESITIPPKIVNNKLVFEEPNWFYNRTVINKTKQSGIFLATQLKATDDLSVILGGRLNNYEYKFNSEIMAKENNYFTPYIALSYDITDNLTTYASYTEIFNPQMSKDKNGNFLEPETGFNYEIGLKGEWFDGKLNSSISLFQSGKDNLAVTDEDPNTGNCYRTPDGGCASKAFDDTKNKGWEFEVAGEITPYWQVQGGFSYSKLEDSKGKPISEGARPLRTAKLFTTYKFESLPQLTLGAGARWESETYSTTVRNRGYYDIGTQKDFVIVDLMANYDFTKNLNLLVNINNAFDKEYKTGFLKHAYGEERNILATLKYKF